MTLVRGIFSTVYRYYMRNFIEVITPPDLVRSAIFLEADFRNPKTETQVQFRNPTTITTSDFTTIEEIV